MLLKSIADSAPSEGGNERQKGPTVRRANAPVSVSALEEDSRASLAGMVRCWPGWEAAAAAVAAAAAWRSSSSAGTFSSSLASTTVSTMKGATPWPRCAARCGESTAGRHHWLLLRGLVNGLLRGLAFGLPVSSSKERIDPTRRTIR